VNCRDTEHLIHAERDGALTDQQRADLDRHVSGCAACRQLRADLAAAAESWRARTAAAAVPDADAEWQKLRAQLHGAAPAQDGERARAGGAEVRTTPKRRLAPVVWLATPLAAAAAFVFSFFLTSGPSPDAGALARAEYVEAGDAGASTMVYADKESGWLVVWAAADSAKTSG